eukprot:scaffold133664_cov20-Tisochrysis_lutea.AAC.2
MHFVHNLSRFACTLVFDLVTVAWDFPPSSICMVCKVAVTGFRCVWCMSNYSKVGLVKVAWVSFPAAHAWRT